VPNYVYECKECGGVFEIFHSISIDLDECKLCNSKNTLIKIPEVPIYLKKNKSGKVVRQHIEDAKQQVRSDKKEMKKDYKD
jgi:putative FmdB family regulatory protein